MNHWTPSFEDLTRPDDGIKVDPACISSSKETLTSVVQQRFPQRKLAPLARKSHEADLEVEQEDNSEDYDPAELETSPL